MSIASQSNTPSETGVKELHQSLTVGRIFLWLGIGLLVLILIILGWRTSHYYKLIKRDGAISLKSNYGFTQSQKSSKESVVTANLALAQSPSLGSPDAKITIVEFADFQCPYSREVFTTMREFVAKNKDKVRLVFRNFPLTDLYPEAIIAAEASRCANEQGKFWAMHDKLFQNQSQLQAADLKNYASQIGLDRAKFDDCLDSRRFREAVLADYQDGFKAGVAGTPTFFINGERAEGAIPLFEWEKLIDRL